MRKMGMLAAGVLAAGMAAALPAAAQQAERGKRAGDIVVGFGGVGVLPTGGGTAPVLGGTITASNSASPQLDFSYFFTPNLAVNLIAATTHHTLRLERSAIGDVKLGNVWALPPTLTVQYHPFPQARLSPYVGLGLNATFFYGHGGGYTAPVRRVRVENSLGVAANIGVDWEFRPNWLFNVDLKFIQMQPEASVNSNLIRAQTNLNPLVVSASVRYRF